MKDPINIIIINVLLTLNQLKKDNSSLPNIIYRGMKITVYAYTGIMNIKHKALLLQMN